MFHEAQHKAVLANILKHLFKDDLFSSVLALKGGTCLYLFHELDRASIDLDFNIINFEQKFNFEKLIEVVSEYVEILDSEEKFYTYYIRGRYKKDHDNIKIEVSKRKEKYDNYEVNLFLGTPIRCVDKKTLFSHKLCAVKGRPVLANRDLYDAEFMFRKMFPVDKRIIQECAGKSVNEYFKELIEYIPKNISKRGILDGLGHLLSEDKKIWAKKNLREDLLFQLRLYADMKKNHL